MDHSRLWFWCGLGTCLLAAAGLVAACTFSPPFFVKFGSWMLPIVLAVACGFLGLFQDPETERPLELHNPTIEAAARNIANMMTTATESIYVVTGCAHHDCWESPEVTQALAHKIREERPVPVDVRFVVVSGRIDPETRTLLDLVKAKKVKAYAYNPRTPIRQFIVVDGMHTRVELANDKMGTEVDRPKAYYKYHGVILGRRAERRFDKILSASSPIEPESITHPGVQAPR